MDTDMITIEIAPLTNGTFGHFCCELK